jgi:hypothetical protein
VLEFGGAYYYVRGFSRVAIVAHTVVCIVFFVIKCKSDEVDLFHGTHVTRTRNAQNNAAMLLLFSGS